MSHEHEVSQRFIGSACDDTAELHVHIGYADSAGDFDCGMVIASMFPVTEETLSGTELMQKAAAAGWLPVVVLTPGEALMLADRLARAARIILESAEDAPDLGREFKMLDT